MSASLTAAEHDLLDREPELAALRLVLDADALTAAVARLPGPPPGRPLVRRLRYKPGSSVVAAVEVAEAGRPSAWFLLAGYAPDCLAKLDKDVRAARGAGVLDAREAWLLAPAASDRRVRLDKALGSDLPDGVPLAVLSYNPRRRLVLRDDRPEPDAPYGRVVKVYEPGVRRLSRGTQRHLAASGVPTPRSLASARRAVHVAARVPGRHADPASDGVAVAAALDVLHRAVLDGQPGRWSAAQLASRVARSATSVAQVLPAVGDLALGLSGRLAAVLPRADLGPLGTMHGDLSPDQVLVSDQGVTIVDLDECAAGPVAWDAATWLAAQLATGAERPVDLPGAVTVPELVAAALALRAVEPFRRRLQGWERTTGNILAAAHQVLDGVEVVGGLGRVDLDDVLGRVDPDVPTARRSA